MHPYIREYFHVALKKDKYFFLSKKGKKIILAKNNLKFLEQVLTYINKKSLDRHSVIIGIGGGSLLDLVGFAAAIGHRGIQHTRIPTTVLAQNDAGVGVKNGINFLNKKNFLGTFAPPMAVINDYLFLNTLNDTHWRAGTSEAVKVALLKDPQFFEWIEQHASELAHRDIIAMQELIKRCAKLHMNHIINNNDPFEQTSARPLDFGHWAAHKLEQLSSFNLTHGEAVAIGISLDCAYAVQKGVLNRNTFHRIIKTFLKLNFDLFHSQLLTPKQTTINPNLLIGLDEFREHLGGNLTITLIKEVGKSFEVNHIDHNAMNKAALLIKEQITAYAV